MPELPEVETTARGITPHVVGKAITDVVVRDPRLRWPVPQNLRQALIGQTVHAVSRRAKYLLMTTDAGTLIVHLGMSGSLRVAASAAPAQPHDHFDLVFGDRALRLRDPRRFGAVLWTRGNPLQHPRLKALGIEPLSAAFNGAYLHARGRGRKQAVKSFIMDSHQVVGVGNIYASEALYLAGIRPTTPAGRISAARYERLAQAIKRVLSDAIAAGGTTLRDFLKSDGQPGYFSQSLRVYGRTGQPCPGCAQPIRQKILGQRSTFYCNHCQH